MTCDGRSVALLAVLAALLACKGSGPSSSASASATAEPRSAAPVAASSAPPAVSLPALAEREIPAGTVTDGGAWLGSYKAGRTDGDAGLGWVEARKLCLGRSMDLCTEPQWRRACGLDAEVGRAASWTSTVKDKNGFVVMGGSGCGAEQVVAGSLRDPARIGLCCNRAIAIESNNKNGAFLRTVAGKLLEFERALNQHSVAAVGALLDDELEFYQAGRVARSTAEGKFGGSYRQYPNQSAVHGQCVVTLHLVGDVEEDKWIAECDKVIDRGGEIAATAVRYEFGGPKTRLRAIKEPRITRDWSAP